MNVAGTCSAVESRAVALAIRWHVRGVRRVDIARRRLVSAALVLIVLLGCAGADPEQPEHHVYLLTSLDTHSGVAGTALGVDLDGVVSSGEGPTCADRHGDFVSVRDPLVTGVDNAFVPGVAQLIVRGRCGSVPDYECASRLNREAIVAGEILWAVEVVGPIDVDGEASVTLHRMSLRGGTPAWVDGHLPDPGDPTRCRSLAVGLGFSAVAVYP